MALGSGGSLGTLTLFIKADTTNIDSAINSVEQKMKRYGSQFAGVTKSLNLTPTVDDSALTNLNKHLDLKQQHFGQVNNFFKSKPLAPAVDLSQLNSLETKLKNIQRLSKEVLEEQGQADTGQQQQGRGGVSLQPTVRVNPRLASVTNRIGGSGEQGGAGGIKATVPVGKVIDAAKIIITSATISVGAGKVAETTRGRNRTIGTAVPVNAPGLNPKVDESVADSLALKLDEIEKRIDRINNKTISIKEDRRGENQESQGGFNPVGGAIAAIAFQGLAKGISASIAGQVQNVGDGLLRSFAESDTFKNLTKTLNIPPEVAQSFGKEAGKEFKKSQQTGVLGFLSKTVGNVFAGITQGIGYRISAGLLQGLERSFGIKLKDVISDAFEAAFNQTKQTLGGAVKSIFNVDFGGDPPTPPKPPGNVVPFPTQQEQQIDKAVANGENVVKFRQKTKPDPPDALKQVMTEGVSGVGDIFSLDPITSLFSSVTANIKGAIDGLLSSISNFFGGIADNVAGLADQFGVIELEKNDDQKIQQVFADLVRQAGAEARESVSDSQIPQLRFDDDITQAYGSKGLYFPNKEQKQLATGKFATVEQNTLVLRKEAQKMLLAIANGIDPKAISDEYADAAESLTHEVKHAFQFKFGQADFSTQQATGNFGNVTPLEQTSQYAQMYAEQATRNVTAQNAANKQDKPEQYLDFIKNIEADAENFGGKYRDVFRPVAAKYQEKSQTKAANVSQQLNLVQQIFKPITDLLAKLAAQVQGLAKATLATAVKSIQQTKEWFKHLYQDPAYTLQQAALAPLKIAGDALTSPVRAVEQNIRDAIAKTVAGAKNSLEQFDIKVEGEEEFGVAASALYEALSLGVDLLPLDQLIANFGDIVGDIQKLQSLKISSDNQFAQFGEIMSQLPAVRQLVTTGARNRKDKNIKSAADNIRRTYDPIQGNEFDDKKEVQLFAVGGYRNAMGMEQPHAGYGSIELAEQFKIATGNDKNVQVNPHVNVYSDSKNAVMRTVGNVVGTQTNEDAVALARRAYAAHQKNPKQRLVLGGHSGGGYNVQDALEILKELGVPATGFGMQTPNFNITRKLGVDDYEALGAEGDNVVNDKLALVKAAGFKPGQDKVFRGGTHASDEFLGRKDSGETILRNVYGESREQPKELKNNVRVYSAPRVLQEFNKTADMARATMRDNPQSPVKTKEALAALRAAREKANTAIAKFPEGLKRSIQQTINETDYVEAKLEGLANAQGMSVLSDLKGKFSSIAETDVDALRDLEKEVFGKLGVYAESVDVQINELISGVGKKLREAKKLARASANQEPAAMQVPAIGTQPQRSRAETSFQALVARSAKASNYGLDMRRMPKLIVDDKRLQQAGAKALYSVKNNQIVITSAIEKLLNSSPEELKKFGSKYAEEVKDLIHEIRHAFQFDLGNLNYADLAGGAKPGALTPFKQTSAKSQEYGNFAAGTDYYKQYAAQMPAGFLDIVRATEADATNFENMWRDIMQGLISDLEQVQSVSSGAVDEPVAYKFSVPGAFSSAAAAVSGQAQSAGNAAATKMVEELERAQKHLTKIAANPKLQQSFGKLQQDAGNLSTRMGVLVQNIQRGTVDIADLPDELGRIFDEMQRVATAASAVPANLQPAPTLRERAGNAARSFQQNAFNGFFDPKRSAQQQNAGDPTAQAEAIIGKFGQVITGESSAFSVIQGAIVGDWAEVFYNFYEEIDKALDSAADTIIDFVEKIPGLQAFAGFLRGAKQFKAVAMGLVGLQLAFKGFENLRQVFDGIEEAFIQAAMGAEKFQRTLTFVLGDAGKASAAIARLQDESNRLGTDAGQSIQGYSQLGAAAKETSLEGSGVDQISSAINQASAVYSLNPEEQGRVNTAVSQMISKNTVSAEELRQQLGEVLPGSFNIAARAAGKTTAEFNQMLETGQVMASDFLPKFAQQLSAETSSGLTGALNSSQAATNRLQNAITRFRVSMGKGLLPERNFVLNNMAKGMEFVEKHAQSLANVMGTLFFRSLFKLAGAFIFFARNLVVSLFNIAAVAAGLGVLQTLIGALTRIMLRFAAQFVVFTLFFDMVQMVGKAWGDASGGLNNFVKTSEEGMRRYTEAVNEARKVNQDFNSSLPKKRSDVEGESTLESTFVGGIIGKDASRWLERTPQKLLGMKTYAEKKLDDTDIASGDIASGANETIAQIMTYRGSKKGGATLELKKVQDIDKQLRDVQAQRRGISRTDPGNMGAIKALQAQESGLLKEREKNFKPLGALQSKLQGEIDGMKEALKKYDELAAEGGVDQETYKTKTDQLKEALAAAEKQQIAFNRSIGGAADSFTYLQRSLQLVADKLAGADSKIKMLSNSARRSLLSSEAKGQVTQGQSQFTQGKIEEGVLAAQIAERKGAIVEMQSLLSQLNSEKVLEANGITNVDDVSAQELNTLADRSKDSPQDAEVFKRLAEVKQVQIETDDLETQLQEKQAAAAQQIRDANKQIGDYFRDVSRQAADLALSSKEAGVQIAMESEKNRLKSKLQGFQDTFFSSFVDYLIEGVDSLNEPIQASLEREKEFQAAEFARQDRDRQSLEISRSLPTLPTQEIKLDFSGLEGNSEVKALQDGLLASVEASKSLTKESGAAGAAIGDSAAEAGVLGDSFSKAIDEASGVASATGDVGAALQDNVSQAQNVNSELQSNRVATEDNRVAVEGVNNAVMMQALNVAAATDATYGSTSATGILQQTWALVTQGVVDTATRTWEWFTGLGKNVPFLAQFGEMIGQWSANVQNAIAKTWEWFQGLFKNIPFLQQIGNIISSWSQNVSEAAGNAWDGIKEQAGNAWDAASHQADRFGNWVSGGGKVTERYRTGTLAAQEYGAPRPGRKHAGQDLDVSGNQEAQSFIGGKVTAVRNDPGGYGKYIDIYNPLLKVVERIAEVGQVLVKVGQEIKPGQAVGRGETGTGVFHYEIRTDANAQGIGGGGHTGTVDPIKFYEKLGIVERQGQNLVIKKGLSAGQTVNQSGHHEGDGHNHGNEVSDPRDRGINTANSGGSSPRSQVLLQRTGIKDDKGLEKLIASIYNAQGELIRQFTVNSGKANTQGNFGGAGSTRSGSKSPLEYGRYSIGQTIAGDSAAVGKEFVPITPQFQTQRSSLGFHFDADRAVGAGSAGCIVFATEAEFKAFQQAIAKNGVNSLVFDGQNIGNSRPQTITGAQATRQATAPPRNNAALAAAGNTLRGGTSGGGARNYTQMSKEDNIQAIVNEAIRQGVTDPDQIAYIVATAKHESGDFRLVREQGGRSYTAKYANVNGNRGVDDAYRFRGAGFTQLTGRGNFDKQSRRMGIDLTSNPDLLADPGISANVLVNGIVTGGFTGRRLDQYIGNGRRDISNARRTVNGYNQDQVNKVNAQFNQVRPQIDQYIARARQGGGAPAPTAGGSAPTAPAAPQQPAIAPVPFASVEGGSNYSSTTVNTSQLSQAQAQSAAIQRQQQANAIAKEQQRIENARKEGEIRQARALEEQRRALLGLEGDRTQVNRQFRDARLDAQVQTPEVEGQRRIIGVEDTYEDMEKDIAEKLLQTRRGRDQATATLGELTSAGYQARPGQDVAKDIEATRNAIATANKYIADLETNQAKIKTLRDDRIRFEQEQTAREAKLRQQQEKFATEEIDISVLEAEADRLKGLQGRGIRDQGVENLPKLEATIAARREQLQLEKQISEIDENARKNGTPADVVAGQKKGLQERLEIVKKTIEANRVYSEELMKREGAKLSREANNAQAQQELEGAKQQLAGLQELARLNPNAEGVDQIAALEEAIALKENELKLTNDLAAAEQERFENKINDDQYKARVEAIQKANQLEKENIFLKRRQAEIEATIARARFSLANREQDQEVKGSVTEALAKNIEYGRSQGDPISMRFEQQKAQQAIAFDKQMLDLDELEASGKRTKEEIDALRESYKQLNDVSLDNLRVEQQRAIEDKAMELSGRFSQSRGAVLGGRADLLSSMGLDTQAKSYRKQAAIDDQKQNYSQQSLELERFIAAQGISAEKALELRTNLSEVNNMSLEKITQEFDPLMEVTRSISDSFQSAFASVLSGSKSVGEAAMEMLSSIGQKLADMASQYLTDSLFGKLFGVKNEDKEAEKAGLISEGGVLAEMGAGNPLAQYSMLNPLPVTVANASALGGGATGILGSGFQDGGGNFIDKLAGGSIFGGGVKIGGNPLPVSIDGAAGGVFDPITSSFSNVFSSIGNIFSGGGGIGNAVGGIASAIFGGSGGSAGKSGIGNILGVGMSLLGFAKGGEIGKGGTPLIDKLSGALAKERAMSGRKAHLIAASEGEIVVPNKIVDRLTRKQRAFLAGQAPSVSIANFSTGGVVGGQMGSAIASNVTNMGGSTNIEGSTVNVGDSGSLSKQDAQAMKAAIDSAVMATISKQMRPRGLLAR